LRWLNVYRWSNAIFYFYEQIAIYFHETPVEFEINLSLLGIFALAFV